MMDESSYQFLLVSIILTIFFHSLFIALQGFRNETSWFAMLLAAGIFAQSLFTYPSAFAGNVEYAWLIGIDESTLLLEVIVISLCSLWVGHLLARSSARPFVKRWRVPALRIKAQMIEKSAFYLSFVGPILVIISTTLGAYGYFKGAAYIESPPLWHGVLSNAVSLCLVVSFIVFYSAYRRDGKQSVSHLLLIALWMLAGLLSGYKAQVILPVILSVVAAWMTKRIGVRHYAALFLAFVFAYSTVEPMRELSREGNEAANAYDLLVTVVTDDLLNGDEISGIFEKITGRLDYSVTAIHTLRADRYGYIEGYKNAIREQYTLLPELTFLPRAVWPDKPLANFGQRLSIALNDNSRNSISPSGPVISYLTGGYWLVVCAAIVKGWVMTLCALLLLKYKDQPMTYAPMYLLAFSLTTGSEYFSTYLINTVRVLIVVYIMYILLGVFGLTSRSRSMRALQSG